MSFNEMECSPEYVLTPNDHCKLEKLMSWKPPFRDDLTKSIRIAALKANSYVFPLISFSGDEVLSVCCGTILEAEKNNNVLMTSLNLIRLPSKSLVTVEKSLANNLKIVVCSGDNLYVAEICAYDFHYNILIIKFKPKAQMFDHKFSMEKSFQLPQGSKTKPGDPVIVVGRYFYQPFNFMAVTGDFSMERCSPKLYDCRELFVTDCLFHQCCEGGPLLNLSGEVLGMVFYEPCSRPVLPIDIVYKWWEHYKIFRRTCHPSYGFEDCDFYAAKLSTIGRFVRQFPNISKGIVVSCAQPESGMREDDVIVKCDDIFVESFSEFWSLIWEKVGQTVKLLVARIGAPSLESIDIPVHEATKVNDWPRFG